MQRTPDGLLVFDCSMNNMKGGVFALNLAFQLQ